MAYNITDIENITEDMAREIGELKEVKGHQVYLVDFGGYFKRSLLVFRNGRQIKYANEYELHHDWWVKENPDGDLFEYMLGKMERKLFTDDEFGVVVDYDDYDRKASYLHNYYGLQTEYQSIFGIYQTEEEKKAIQKKIKTWFYNPVGFCYMPDKAFVDRHIELMNTLEKAKNSKANDYAYYKDAFKREMANHEYHINWQADYDTLSAFGNVEWHGENVAAMNKYFDELNFTETQRKAYIDARREYLKECDY